MVKNNCSDEITHTEIKDLVASFVRTAEVAYRAGFDGVEIHAAHGYLLNQFLSPWDTRREDEYGASIENRMCVIEEIYEGIRAHTPADFIVGIKINSSDIKEGTYETLVTDHVSTSIAAIDKKLGSILGIVYYELLMRGYARSKAPHVSSNVWPALFHALRTQGTAALFPQRTR